MQKQSLPLLGAAPRKCVAAVSPKGEADRKRVAAEVVSQISLMIERAIALSGLTKQQLSAEMGYTDQSALSRWISGAEPLQFARLWSVKAFQAAFVMAQAEQVSEIEVHTEIRVRRSA